MPTFGVSDRYRVFCDGMSVGILTVNLVEDGVVWGVIEFDEEIKSQRGWKAKRIATALDAFSEFVRVRDEEVEDSQSNRMQLAVDRVEDGEIGHYLFVVPWHVCDETRELRIVDLIAIWMMAVSDGVGGTKGRWWSLPTTKCRCSRPIATS